MPAYPVGAIVGGVSCLAAGAAVMTVAVGTEGGASAPMESEAPKLAAGTIEAIFATLNELRLSCAKGEGDACYELAGAYETRQDLWGQGVRGEGVRRDDAKAAGYLRFACEAGIKKACARLAWFYETGKGVTPDSAMAARYYHKACGLRDGDGCADLPSTFKSE